MADAPVFVSEDGLAIAQDTKAFIENATGQVLSEADIEASIANAWAYREKNINVAINNTAVQNLVAFATGSVLDGLGELVGVLRLPSSGALCMIQFQLVDGHPATTLPDSIRVQSADGKAIFITTESVFAPVGSNTVTVSAICITTGAAYNGYAIDSVSIILDPKPYLTSATNTTATSGGADIESDDNLRQRIILAPSAFSVAGPSDAYIFWTKTANANIVDVGIDSLNPGEVDIYPLMAGGQIPSTDVLNQVTAVLNDTKVRPLCDTVVVAAPTQVNYSIEVGLVLYNGADDDSTLATVNANIANYVQQNINSLGRDVIVKQLEKLCIIDGQVYDVTVTSPSGNIVVGKNEFANCTGVTVNITSYNEG